MARRKDYTPGELAQLLDEYDISSDENSNLDDMGDSSEDEFEPLEESNTSSSSSSEEEEETSNPHPVNQPVPSAVPSTANWIMDLTRKDKLNFNGNSGLHKRITANEVTPIMVFEQMLDSDIIQVMVTETNRYAQQYLAKTRLSRGARMNKWQDVTEVEMKKFIGIIIVTGLLKFPRIEDYWKKDQIFFHPLFHHIQMTYNRFGLLLKNWHFSNNDTVTPGDRLHKISNIMDMIISNIQQLYTPGEEISVDETMISHRGRLLFRQYNPGKSHKYGIKIFKLCDMSGFIWNASVYCGKGSGNKRPGLDHSGSVIIDLGEKLLNCGRLFVADNWYSSIELAKYLKANDTEYCGTLKRNRRNLPENLKKMKLKKGEIKGASNDIGIRIVKYQDKREILLISTFHGTDKRETGKRNRSGESVLKPSIIVDYNRVKGGIDLSDQMIEYYSPARKSVKWYRKVVFQLISMVILDSWVIHNKYYSPKKNTLVDFTKSVALALIGVNIPSSIRVGPTQDHQLTQIPRQEANKIVRKRCYSCYEKISQNEGREKAKKKKKQVATHCLTCKKVFCLTCFNENHGK